DAAGHEGGDASTWIRHAYLPWSWDAAGTTLCPRPKSGRRIRWDFAAPGHGDELGTRAGRALEQGERHERRRERGAERPARRIALGVEAGRERVRERGRVAPPAARAEAQDLEPRGPQH